MNVFEHLNRVATVSGWSMERILHAGSYDQRQLSNLLRERDPEAVVSHGVVTHFIEQRRASAVGLSARARYD